MEIVTLREFARRIGVSLTAVQKAIKNGRIKAQTDDAGKVKGIDWETESIAWTENSKAPQRKPKNPNGGRPRKDGTPAARAATAAPLPDDAPAEGEIVEHLEHQPHGGALKRAEKTPPTKGPMTITEIQRARELVKLQLDNLKLKEAQGELVSAKKQREEGAKLGATLIAGLYNMPERLADDFAGMSDPHEIQRIWVEEIDKLVQDMRSKYGV